MVILLFWLLIGPLFLPVVRTGAVVALSQAGSPTQLFFDAFTNESVSEILVDTTNYLLSNTAWAVFNEEQPYLLKRDLNIHSVLDPVGILDFQFMQRKVLIASGVTVTMERLALQNIRKLGGFALDFFSECMCNDSGYVLQQHKCSASNMGEENSTIILRDVMRIKMVCNTLEGAFRSASTFKAIPPFPPNNITKVQDTCVTPANGVLRCYDNSLHFNNFIMLVRNTDPEAGRPFPGYVLYMENVTRVCNYYITEQCLAAYGQDSCIAEMLDQLLNTTRNSLSPGTIAGIAVAGTVVVVAAVLCYVLRAHVAQCLVCLGGKSLQDLESSSSPSGGDGGMQHLFPGSSSTATTLVGSSRQSITQDVRLGVLLGSGSFGRVYKGRWHSIDVAVKIISCTPDELPKVLKEAEVMMQLHHPNVLRAYQCSVWNPAEQQRVLQRAQLEQHQQQLQGPATTSRGREGPFGPRLLDTPISSIAHTAVHSSAGPVALCQPGSDSSNVTTSIGSVAPHPAGSLANAGAVAEGKELAAGIRGAPEVVSVPQPRGNRKSNSSSASSSEKHGPPGRADAAAVKDALKPFNDEPEERKEVQVWLVLELCTGGTLKDAVSMGEIKVSSRLETAKLLSRLLDAANGMTYLHSKGVLHGDLKAGNVLLYNTMHGAYGQVAKISDFGLAATLMDGATHRSTASMGTITHMAPEVLRSGHMSAAADVYSFGIMMWELYTNQQAHAGLHYGAVVERVVLQGVRPVVPSHMPSEYAVLMTSCWDANPSKRPTFSQVLTCLELMLDSLTSDSEGRISERSEEESRSISQAGGSVHSGKQTPDQKRESLGAGSKGSALLDARIGSGSSGPLLGTSSGPSMPAIPAQHPELPSQQLSTGVLAASSSAASPMLTSSSAGVQDLDQPQQPSTSLQDLQTLHRWQQQQQQQKGGGAGHVPGLRLGVWGSASGSSANQQQPITPQQHMQSQQLQQRAPRIIDPQVTAGSIGSSPFVQDL
eukprot:gene5704-5944_t